MAMNSNFLVLAVLLAGSVSVRAEEGKASSLISWFKNWKHTLERTAVESKYRRMRTATAVAAVRGSCQDKIDPNEPYWKGGWSEKRLAERAKERQELAGAVSLIMDGKMKEGRQALDAFDSAHPKSSFCGEVAEARAKLDEIEGKTPPAAAEPEKESVPDAGAVIAEPGKEAPAKTEAAEPASGAP